MHIHYWQPLLHTTLVIAFVNTRLCSHISLTGALLFSYRGCLDAQIKQRRYIIWRFCVITFATTNKMSTTYPGVLRRPPILPIYSGSPGPVVSLVGIHRESIKMKSATLVKLVGASNSTSPLTVRRLCTSEFWHSKWPTPNFTCNCDVSCTRSILHLLQYEK